MKEGETMGFEIKDEFDLWDLEDKLWSGAEQTVRQILDADKEDEFEQLWFETWADVPDLVEVFFRLVIVSVNVQIIIINFIFNLRNLI